MIIDLIRELNELDEHPTLEAKACASGDLGDSFFETVCGFSNEPDLGGGTIVLGIARNAEDFFGGYAPIFVREQGAINNQTLRQLTGSDILTASQDLRKLRDLGLVAQKGKGLTSLPLITDY